MKLLITMSVASVLFAIASCNQGLHASKDANSAKKSSASDYSQVDSNIIQNMNSFAFQLIQEIQTEVPDDKNMFVSPLSLHMDLGMLLNGSAGETYDEIVGAMNLKGQNLDKINGTYAALLSALPGADPKVSLGLYNSMWYKNGFKVNPSYNDRLETDFKAKIEGLDFKPGDEAVINKWASDKTNGKITQVIDKIKDDQVMFLLNALYFKGDWSIQFKKEKTTEMDFHLSNGETSQVKMMNNTDTFYHFIGEDYSAIRLPYGNGRFNMTVLLPKDNQSLNTVLSTFTLDKWTSLQENMKKSKVRIGLPRFTIPKFEIKLNAVLKKMGISSAFNGGAADFTKMASTKNLALSFIKQDSYLRVDEEGTEAAAVTTGGMTVTSMPMISSIICDHPFGIIISDQKTRAILFMGKIMAPASDS